jgi:hypothetical protein
LLQQTQQAEAAEGTAAAAAAAATGGVPDRAAFTVALLNRVRAQCSPFLQAEPSQRPSDERDAAEGQPAAPPAGLRTQSMTGSGVGNDRGRRSVHADPVPLPAEFPPLVRTSPAYSNNSKPSTHSVAAIL